MGGFPPFLTIPYLHVLVHSVEARIQHGSEPQKTLYHLIGAEDAI